MIRVVADENIPAIRDALPAEVDLHLLPGRQMTRDALKTADALLVRSVTKVGAPLLEGTAVQFVASATAGIDHLDVNWLEEQGISWNWAPGSNATSVAEYVMAAMFLMARREGMDLNRRTLGIIGVGQCGSRVEQRARALGMKVLLCDPPLARDTGDSCYQPLEALQQADILTLHVPLTESGPDATRNMIGRAFFEGMKPGAWLINASRGGIVDEEAWLEAIRTGGLQGIVDAWAGEPRINAELLSVAAIGTPHIAGYSADGKMRGAQMVAEALAEHFELKLNTDAPFDLGPVDSPLSIGEGSATCAVADLVKAAYSLESDAQALRNTAKLPEEDAARRFDELRKNYPVRREFDAYTVLLPPDRSDLRPILEGLGFRVR